MNTKQIMDEAVQYTTEDYVSRKETSSVKETDIESVAVIYSALSLTKGTRSKSRDLSAYESNFDLKAAVRTLKRDDMRRELLKNIVSNAVLFKMNMSDSIRANDTRIRYGISKDDASLVIYNNMLQKGVKKGYSLLSNYSLLLNACELYARNRVNNRSGFFDELAETNEDVIKMHDQIDEYFENKKQTKDKAKQLIKK